MRFSISCFTDAFQGHKSSNDSSDPSIEGSLSRRYVRVSEKSQFFLPTVKGLIHNSAYYPDIKIICRTGNTPIHHRQKEQSILESVNGANASAVIYSIIETAKANNLHVHRYLEFIITELSKRRKARTLDHIDDLLPWAKIPQKECKAPIKNS